MTRFKKRLPAQSDLWAVFLLCLIITNFWAILRFLQQVPRFILMLDIGRIVGSFAYFGSFALFDAILLWLPIVLIAMLLPATWLRDHFLVRGSLIVLIFSIWLWLNLAWFLHIFGWAFFGLSALFFVLAIGLAIGLSHPKLPIGKLYLWLQDRFSPLALLYLGIDILSVLIVVGRNVWSVLI